MSTCETNVLSKALSNSACLHPSPHDGTAGCAVEGFSIFILYVHVYPLTQTLHHYVHTATNTSYQINLLFVVFLFILKDTL